MLVVILTDATLTIPMNERWLKGQWERYRVCADDNGCQAVEYREKNNFLNCAVALLLKRKVSATISIWNMSYIFNLCVQFDISACWFKGCCNIIWLTHRSKASEQPVFCFIHPCDKNVYNLVVHIVCMCVCVSESVRNRLVLFTVPCISQTSVCTW